MPPSKPACEAIAKYYKAEAVIIEKWLSIKSALSDLMALKLKSKWGLFGGILDTIGAEAIAAVAAVSSKVAENLLGSVSKMAASYLELIFSTLLQILLAVPTAIFSLVAIPHSAAIDATKLERKYLTKARANMRVILSIILRWTRGKSGKDYYEQIKRALPAIIRAIKLCAEIIRNLENEENSVFSESHYKSMRGQIDYAIRTTEPQSFIVNMAQINSRIEADKNRIYNELAKEINKEYANRRRVAGVEYRDKVREINFGSDKKEIGQTDKQNNTSLPTTPPSQEEIDRETKNKSKNRAKTVENSLSNELKKHKVKMEYEFQLKLIDNWREQELAKAEIQAQKEATYNADVLKDAFSDLGSRFVNDMKILGDQLVELLDNVKDAYLKNKESQLLCNNIYDIKNLIRTIIREVISHIRAAGNVAAAGLLPVFDTVQSLLEVTQDKFQGSVDRYEGVNSDITATELSYTVAIGHGLLLSADAAMDATITESLVDLINSDDVLDDADGEFQAFTERLEAIPDWDGETGVWAVNMLNSSISPYIQLIVDLTEMVAKVPILSLSAREKDKRRARLLIVNSNNTFRVLLRHNSTVANTLSSYTPYSSSEAGNLKKILASAGLLNQFALGMSLTTLVVGIFKDFDSNFGDEMPTADNCKFAYPDLFDDPSLSKGETSNYLNYPDQRFQDNGFQKSVELHAFARNNLQMKIRALNFKSVVDSDSDLNNGNAAPEAEESGSFGA